MKGTAARGPLPRKTETRARPSRVGRMTCLSPAAEISISSARRATNSESMATGEPGVGASVAGLNGMPGVGEIGEMLFILERLINVREQGFTRRGKIPGTRRTSWTNHNRDSSYLALLSSYRRQHDGRKRFGRSGPWASSKQGRGAGRYQ